MSAEKQDYIQLDATHSGIQELTVFGFKTTLLSGAAVGDQLGGELLLDGEPIDVQFRVRRKNGDQCVCTFFDLDLSTRETIDRYVRSLQHETVADEMLEGLSYDDLAKGLPSSDDPQPTKKECGCRQSADEPSAHEVSCDAGNVVDAAGDGDSGCVVPSLA